MSVFPQTESAAAARRQRDREELALLALLAFTWDTERLRYIARNGSVVPQGVVRAAVDRVAAGVGEEVAELGRQVSARDIGVDEWREGVARRLKPLHVAATAAASGGFENMSPAVVAKLESRLRFHFTLLERFAEDVGRGFTVLRSEQMVSETGEVQTVTRVMTEHRIVARSLMYVAAAVSGSYEGGRRDAAIAAGMRFVKNVLHPADHCRTEPGKEGVGCLDETLRGWVEIGALTAPGERRCKTMCKCSLSYARELPN